jgi:hydrogenase-4 component B
MIETVALEVFFLLCALGALLALTAPEKHYPSILAIVGLLASVAAGVAAGYGLFSEHALTAELWPLPTGSRILIGLDRLSGLFLLVAVAVFLPTSVYSAGYLRRYLGHYSLRPFGVLYFGLFASIVAIILARDIVFFLLTWELMSIASYLLVNFEFERDENVRAGYLMLAMGEAGTLAAALALLLLANAAGSFDFPALKLAGGSLGADLRWAIFLLSFFGFGVKAGLIPFNSWLPRAHPVAPANVSALLSAVILNLGIYGIVRINVDLIPANLLGTGVLALIVGTVSAFVGILYATTESDAKAMLAHSSIENMGIVTAGLGAGFVFTAAGHPALAGIAFVAALYHLTNHSIYKALLFLGAGTVDYRVGTRDLDRLGGLIHGLPWTTLFFLIGSLSIAAVYPFSGFASEWLTLQALLRSAELPSTAIKIVFALCGVGLALTAALAVTCFVKAFAMGFLGMPRSQQAQRASEAPTSMLAPMGALAILSVVLGIIPTFVIPTLSNTLQSIGDGRATQALVPPFFAGQTEHAALPPEFASEFHDLGAQLGEDIVPGRGLVVLHRGEARNPVIFAMSTSYGVVILLVLLGVTWWVVRQVTRSRRTRREAPWDGGVRHLFPEMTYSATGFSNPVRVIFDAILRPRTQPDSEDAAALHFRAIITRTRQQTHLVDRLFLDVVTKGLLRVAAALARMHHGRVSAYVAYVLFTLLVFLVLAAVNSRSGP